MLIYAIDDEPLILESLRRAIAEAAPQAEIRCFSRISQVLQALEEEKETPAFLFSDIELPGMSGLELAVKLRSVCPGARLVFVTGYSQYAIEAFRLQVSGYIMKPVTADRVREELSLSGVPTAKPADGRLEIRCFGAFEVYWHGEPLVFSRKKTKELLAYLVDRRGELCTAGEIIAALWEDEGDAGRNQAYLRTLTADLHAVLSEIGMGDVLLRSHRQWAVRPERLICDYYRMLAGDMEAVNSYRGEYMSRYSWAELTAGQLEFQKY